MNISPQHASPRSLRGLLALLLLTLALSGCEQYTTAPAFAPIPSVTPSAAPTGPAKPASNAPGPNEPSKNPIILSIEESGYAHLFAYSPSAFLLTRLTWGDWNDVTPALRPDGRAIAFASDRGGHWDLYEMDLQSAAVSQLTNTPEYDSSPTWSPDLAWIAYETYHDGHLDIAILSATDVSQAPVLLTDDAAADHSPAWAPNGREIAFVSNRTGDAEIWMADLNKTQDRFTNLTHTPQTAEDHPAWSSNGAQLAWAASIPSPGFSGIYVWDAAKPERPAVWAGEGNWPAWNADGSQLAAAVHAPNSELLSAYGLDGKPLILPARMPGRIHGLLWPPDVLPDPLAAAYQRAGLQTPPALVGPSVTPISGVPSNRWYVVPLEDVEPPSAQLHALVAQSFTALRQRVIAATGWDAMASLEAAYVPLTTALEPGLEQDWLYTGRAFAINSLMANAGWMSVAREDVGVQTYWRLYLRAQHQDGSQGAPLENPPWDLNARYQLNPQEYEAGGGFAPVPSGYWVDLTALASAYGWERLPALPNWRSYYPGARFTEFTITGGLDWYSAMLELYPSDALLTATAVLPPTATPSRTPIPTDTPGPTRTPRPTFTPSITQTPRPTLTPSITPTASSTPPTIIPTFPSPTP